MDSGADLTHYYHANATAWGGRLEQPIDVTLPMLAPISLSTVGGYGAAQHEDFEVGGIISIKKAWTQVSGSQELADGSFNTLVTAVVEGLDIVGIFHADRITLQIATNHPPIGSETGPYYPSVSFEGAEYVGLRAGDSELIPILNKMEFFHDNGKPYHPKKSWLEHGGFREFAQRQSRNLSAGAAKVRHIPVFDRLFDRHSGEGPNSDQRISERGNVICSVVDAIEIIGKTEDKRSVGHVLSVPGLGRIFLGELIVDGNSFNLNMLRVDMGSAAAGRGSGPGGGANGTTSGPG